MVLMTTVHVVMDLQLFSIFLKGPSRMEDRAHRGCLFELSEMANRNHKVQQTHKTQ